MFLTNLLLLGRKLWWRGGSTASRQLSEVKHVPVQLVLRWVTTLEPWVQNIFHCSHSDVRHVPTSPGIEPGTSAFSLPRW